MAAINKALTEEQLQDIHQAIRAVQLQKGKSNEDAERTAQLLTYATFRNLITYDSIVRSIVDNAREVFSV
jgi:DNA-binding protein H-NS